MYLRRSRAKVISRQPCREKKYQSPSGGVEVTNIRGHVADGQVEHFQVEMKIGFRLED